MSKIEVNTVAPQCGTTLTLGESGDTVTLGTGASQSGFGRTGTVDWETTPKTSTFTAVSGDGFFCNTTSGGFTANLPAGVAGAIVSFADYAGTWQTGNLTVSPNGSDKIGGVNADVTLNTQGQSVTFVFADSTQGWINVQDSTSNERGNAFMSATGGTITESGNCKIHTFTGPGTFTVCATAACAANNVVSYLVVAGGGGGAQDRAGGGGAGGYRELASPSAPYTASPLNGYPSAPNRVTVTATAFPITVGGGGAGGPSGGNGVAGQGSNGNPSVFSTITAAGGGGGAPGCANDGANPPAVQRGGKSGGSGGGGGSGNSAGGLGGSGNTPPVTPAQGTDGGDSSYPSEKAAGGGGATGAGVDGLPGGIGTGGAGATSCITASPVTRAGGGGGGITSGTAGAGGSGGGGAGASGSPTGTAGTTNTGGGGGGGGNPSSCGGAGGSGIVIIRYKFQ